jgi:hypothetical protein
MKAPIELHQLAEMRFALASTTVRASLPASAPQTGGQHPSPQRVVMDVHAILARQVLGRERRPKPLVNGAAVFLTDQR